METDKKILQKNMNVQKYVVGLNLKKQQSKPSPHCAKVAHYTKIHLPHKSIVNVVEEKFRLGSRILNKQSILKVAHEKACIDLSHLSTHCNPINLVKVVTIHLK